MSRASRKLKNRKLCRSQWNGVVVLSSDPHSIAIERDLFAQNLTFA